MATRSEIILFMTQEALDRFMKGQGWSIGAAGIAVISKGLAGDYDANTFKKPVLGFVFGEKGLIADLSFEGSKINKIKKRVLVAVARSLGRTWAQRTGTPVPDQITRDMAGDFDSASR
jgi:lipid-binding SYLF domain-containing protein